ncbi:MAG TPA: TolC family protein [Fimbriimonadales bacterium]|nr:TolC family protein [Fimbriimonadales bacterium]
MRTLLTLLALLSLVPVHAQGLTLEEAADQAMKSNGRIQAAKLDYEAARLDVTVAAAAFFPSVTPRYTHVEQRSNGVNGDDSFDDLSLGANWLLLDSGQRAYALAGAKDLREAAKYGSKDTIRQILFSVITQFHEVLRAQELLRVAEAQLARADQTLSVTTTQVEVGDAAKKEILQAEADKANAVVSSLSATNAVNTFKAALKASIGWPAKEDLPDLVPPEPPTISEPPTLEETIDEGIKNRPDLAAARSQLHAQRYSVLLAKQRAGLDWELSADYSQGFGWDHDESKSLQFVVTYPLFDGGALRALAKEAELGYEASQALYEQQVRDARSEIESAYLVWTQDRRILDASDLALKAAQENFNAASESQSLGAGTIIEVTAAQLALVTAETNRVQALYDYLISEMELKLVTGAPLPGEGE